MRTIRLVAPVVAVGALLLVGGCSSASEGDQSACKIATDQIERWRDASDAVASAGMQNASSETKADYRDASDEHADVLDRAAAEADDADLAANLSDAADLWRDGDDVTYFYVEEDITDACG